ncbi:MAG: DUF1971 domain-containing protein [Porticoccaceae bacterium]
MSSSDYQSRHPGALPAGLKAYRRTDVFNEETLPAALRKSHAVKEGVWALLHVLEGRLRYRVPSWNYDEILEPDAPGIIAPQVEHFVEPQGKVRVFIEFHACPEDCPPEPRSKL